MSRPSLRAAIDAMCKHCIYDPGSGNGGWREQVANCSSSNCPLHLVRPLPVKTANPDTRRRSSASRGIDVINRGQPQFASEMGLNVDSTDERRAA